MKAGGNTQKVGKNSPQGDLSKRGDDGFNHFFKRKIKSPGKSEHAGYWLPVRPFTKAGGND